MCLFKPQKNLSPVLITDTILSDSRGIPQNFIPTRTLEYYKKSNIIPLYRKFITTEDKKTIISFSGSVKKIIDFLDYAEFSIDNLTSYRPLKNLAERASEYNGDIDVIAISCGKDLDRLHYITSDKSKLWESDNFGFYSSIGSGSDYFNEYIKRHDDPLLYGTQNENAISIAHEFITGNFVSEIYNSPKSNLNWGGFFELSYFDWKKNEWVTRGKTAYFIYQFHFSKEEAPDLIDRIYLYDPGEKSGFIHYIRSASDYSHNITVPIFPINQDMEFEIPHVDISSWYPDFLCISLIGIENHDNGAQTLHTANYFYPVTDIDGVSTGYGRTGIRFLPHGPELDSFLISEERNMRDKYIKRYDKK